MPGRKKITAKVKLGSRYELSNGDFGLTFYPDYFGDKAEVNKAWATASPSLMFQMTVRADVAEHFKQGTSYTVTFEEEVPDGGNTTA